MKRRDDGIDVQGKSPGFWYYPQDVERDIQILTLGAQGLWLRMLGWMHFNQSHRGYLELATGEPMNDEDIAARVGKSVEEVRRHLAEMRRIGLFSEDERGCIWNRRMVRDTEISRKRADAAKHRANESKRDENGQFAGAKHPIGGEQNTEHPPSKMPDKGGTKREQNTVPSDSVSSSPSDSLLTPEHTTPKPKNMAQLLREDMGGVQFEELQSKMHEYGITGGHEDWSIARSMWNRREPDLRQRILDSLIERIQSGDNGYSASSPQKYIENHFQRAVKRMASAAAVGGSTLADKMKAHREQKQRILEGTV